jgi:hypothetical protein
VALHPHERGPPVHETGDKCPVRAVVSAGHHPLVGGVSVEPGIPEATGLVEFDGIGREHGEARRILEIENRLAGFGTWVSPRA